MVFEGAVLTPIVDHSTDILQNNIHEVVKNFKTHLAQEYEGKEFTKKVFFTFFFDDPIINHEMVIPMQADWESIKDMIITEFKWPKYDKTDFNLCFNGKLID